MKITNDNAHEFEIHRFSAFASDLGLPPGHFPELLETSLGNGQPFVRRYVSQQEGDVTSVSYRQQLGCVSLEILND